MPAGVGVTELTPQGTAETLLGVGEAPLPALHTRGYPRQATRARTALLFAV